jgi:hypothetical protein
MYLCVEMICEYCFVHFTALHEKLFVVFMVVAVVYEILATILFSWCHRTPQSPLVSKSERLEALLHDCTTA